jgi:hypothetical protein
MPSEIPEFGGNRCLKFTGAEQQTIRSYCSVSGARMNGRGERWAPNCGSIRMLSEA